MSRETKSKPGSVPQKRSSVIRILAILWLLVIVGVILIIKETPLVETLSGAGAISLSTLEQKTTKISNVGIPEYTQVIMGTETSDYAQEPEYTQTSEFTQTPEYTQEDVATIAHESSPAPDISQVTANPLAGASPAEQYKSAIANRKPTLVFFHSNTCKSCLQMIDTVNAVYPEFFHLVVLIDVNVYDPQNEDLTNRVGINLIPTLVFYNQNGDSLFSIGVISKEELRQKLTAICQGKIP